MARETINGISVPVPGTGEPADFVGDLRRIATDLPFQMALSTAPPLQQAKVDLAILQNETRTPPTGTVVSLISGAASDGTPTAFGGQTVTRVTDRTVGSSDGAWKTDATTGAVCRLDIPLAAAPVTIGPAQAVAAWVWIEDTAKTTEVQLVITGGAGSWTRLAIGHSGSSHTGGTFKRGWNLIRWESIASTHANLTGATVASVRFTVNAATTNYVGRVYVETPSKAKLIFVDDWGSKPFFDIGRPDLHALGVPITWGVRVDKIGTGTYPNNHVSLAELATVAAEGDVISFHSWDGSATSSMTAAQIDEEIRKVLAGLQTKGIYTDGALWRSAWVQNIAPNAAAGYKYLVGSRTSGDNYADTAWPPVKRYNAPSFNVHGRTDASFDSIFTQLQNTRRTVIFYTHGIVPDASEPNHASQATWNYFVSKVSAALTAGWLEATTVPALMQRYRMRHLGDTLADRTVLKPTGLV